MKRSGSADLPLHYGYVPVWLAERMAKLGLAVVENILLDYGKDEVLRRLSDPFWFQSLGAVLGMDWHSSGITTSVMGALKRSVNERSKELGIYICGGKGRYSRETPAELLRIAEHTGLNGDLLVRSSKLSAKVDNTAIQDGFQLYLHSFILTCDGMGSSAAGYERRIRYGKAVSLAFTNAPIFGGSPSYIYLWPKPGTDNKCN